jgi:hypothetical protein
MKRLALSAIGLAMTALAGVTHADITVNPTFAGPADAGTGANATFIAIDGNWNGSTVLWNETTRQYGNDPSAAGFAPIGSYAWGTGLWGRADWQTINAPGSTVPVLTSASMLAPVINYGNNCFNQSFAPGIPMAQPFPVSAAPSACPPGAAVADNLNNWTSRFTGFIRITTPGAYNFSVLSDDGFFFDLYGAGGAKQSIQRDFLNARNVDSFSQNLVLSQGLYQFELGAWDRLEAGAVDLRWRLPGATDFTLIPAQNLVASVSMPGTMALGAIAGLFGWAARRRRPAA